MVRGRRAGARSLVRTGPGDWFALGHVEAVRTALGAAPGSAAAEVVGVPSVNPDEPLGARVGRAVALALLAAPEVSADVGVDEAAETAEVALGAAEDYELGRPVTRWRWPLHRGAARLDGRARAGDSDVPALAGVSWALGVSDAAVGAGAGRRGAASG